MEQRDYGSALLSGERSNQNGSFLTVVDEWIAREFVATPEKLDWIWGELQKYKTLFSDFNRGDPRIFEAQIIDPYSYWIEILNSKGDLVGIIYLNNLQNLTDAKLNVIFFDRSTSAKARVCAIILHHMFKRFPGLHRVSVVVPEIYHATIRLLRKIKFRHEGTMRETQLIGGRWVNECIFGILDREVLNAQSEPKLHAESVMERPKSS